MLSGVVLRGWTATRPQTADRRPETADHRPQIINACGLMLEVAAGVQVFRASSRGEGRYPLLALFQP